MFCNFSLKLNMANLRHIYFKCLMGPETEEKIKLVKNKICFVL